MKMDLQNCKNIVLVIKGIADVWNFEMLDYDRLSLASNITKVPTKSWA